MSQGKRITIAVLIIFVIAGGIMAVEMIRRQTQQTPTAGREPDLSSGSIPIYHDGALVQRLHTGGAASSGGSQLRGCGGRKDPAGLAAPRCPGALSDTRC